MKLCVEDTLLRPSPSLPVPSAVIPLLQHRFHTAVSCFGITVYYGCACGSDHRTLQCGSVHLWADTAIKKAFKKTGFENGCLLSNLLSPPYNRIHSCGAVNASPPRGGWHQISAAFDVIRHMCLTALQFTCPYQHCAPISTVLTMPGTLL